MQGFAGGVAIAFIEKTIQVNNIDLSAAPLMSSGQLIPFFIGIFTIVAVLGAGLKRRVQKHARHNDGYLLPLRRRRSTAGAPPPQAPAQHDPDVAGNLTAGNDRADNVAAGDDGAGAHTHAHAAASPAQPKLPLNPLDSPRDQPVSAAFNRWRSERRERRLDARMDGLNAKTANGQPEILAENLARILNRSATRSATNEPEGFRTAVGAVLVLDQVRV